LHLIIGALAVAVVIFGYQYYENQQHTSTIEIGVGKGGLSVKTA
jgi:tRNA G46 methylase TrmB